MKHIFLGLLLLCLSQPIFSQTISGTVSAREGNRNVPVPFANVYWLNTLSGTMTDDNGRFSITQTPADGNRLVVSFVGYTNDTIEIRPGQNNLRIILEQNIMLDEVQIVERQRGHFIDQLNPQRMDVITIAGLCQLACCNLAESFENSATVDVSFADAISGARQIQMLGLTGLHSQLMFENMPFLRGLSAPFGLLYIPGSYMESIQISKGTASVINGFEGLAGQINIEYRKPQTADPLFINLFYDNHHRMEANVIQNNRINDNFGITIFAHYSQFQREKDHLGEDSTRHHGDGFMDKPKSRQFNMAARLNYVDGRRTNITTLMFTTEDRVGGQMSNATPHPDFGLWNFSNRVNRGQIFQKNGLLLSENSSIGTQFGATYMDLRTMYGPRSYDATEFNFYANIIYENRLSEGQTLNLGASFQHNNVEESLRQLPIMWINPGGPDFPTGTTVTTQFSKTENIPGVFAQYTFANDRFTLVGGLRYDYNTLYRQSMITPRFHGRLSVSEHGTLRGSLGRAFRSPIPIAENMNLLASSRVFLFNETGLEDAWNFGLNYHHIFAIDEERTISFALGFYRTVFRNQLIVNLDRSHQQVHFYMSDERSFSNNAQLEIRTDLLPNSNWVLTLAGRYNDSRQTIDGNLIARPFVAPWKFLMVNNISNNLNTWQLDITSQFHGGVRLPNTNYARPTHSEGFPMFHAQITRRFRNLEIYAGVENILNSLQNDPIINAHDPFGPNFDASVIYGSLMERKFYIGIRWMPFGRN
ncbi:MAG: TonB-dependent receptor [Bacteroidales bacterium]|nr:TonB-dependent receptor [Bacteroidales bacterium]